MTEQLMDSRAVAALLGMGEKWVRQQAERGELAGVRLGRNWRFLPADVAAFVEARRTGRAA
jgi:excisionase family DNA binding protein